MDFGEDGSEKSDDVIRVVAAGDVFCFRRPVILIDINLCSFAIKLRMKPPGLCHGVFLNAPFNASYS